MKNKFLFVGLKRWL